MLSKYVFSDLSREYWLKLRYDNQTLKNFKCLALKIVDANY